MTDDDGTMGTTGTPGGSGAAAIDEEDKANGAARGVSTPYGKGGEADDPALPYDHRPDSDDKLHLPRNATSQRGD
jgi:hypothetical protein